MLNESQARELLGRIGDVAIREVRSTGGTNANCAVVTERHGTFHIKLHTAFWYPDRDAGEYAAERGVAAYEVLRKRGMLNVMAWLQGYTGGSMRAMIASHIPGTDGLTAYWHASTERDLLCQVWGNYLRRLHSITFGSAGTIGPAHARACTEDGMIPPVAERAWVRDRALERLYLPEGWRETAEVELDRKAQYLPTRVVAELRSAFRGLTDAVAPAYAPARFTLGNCHICHFLFEKESGRWWVRGVCDVEDAAAGDCVADLLDIELSMVPKFKTYAWRAPLFEGYGGAPDFETYKLRLLTMLVEAVHGWDPRMVPDLAWLNGQWGALLRARRWDELLWFPVSV